MASSSIAVDDSFLSSHNFSLASTGSYTDFQVRFIMPDSIYTVPTLFFLKRPLICCMQHGIMMASEAQKHCRSSAIPKNSSMENVNY